MEPIARAIIGNLHQSYHFKSLSELYNQEPFEIREILGISSYSERVEKPEELFQSVRKHILTKAFQDDELTDFLIHIPDWVGFHVDSGCLTTGENVIKAAKKSVLALMWLFLIPRVIIGHTILPEDYEDQGVNGFLYYLLHTNETRMILDSAIDTELDRRGFGSEFFNISDIVKGYKIAENVMNDRIRILIALLIMKATDCPFDLDRVFKLDETEMIQETNAYIIMMHAQNNLRNRIKGSSSSRPFEWPLVGTPRVFAGILSALNIMRKYSSVMSTCSLYKVKLSDKIRSWNESEFISFLLNEITDYYEDLRRAKSTKKKNGELRRFVDLLRGENIEITARIMDSNDQSGQLHKELTECKRRARSGEKPQISPERRFRVVLSTLKQSLEDIQNSDIPTHEIVDQIAIAFNAIPDLIEKHHESLGSESDKFAEELCFEVSYRIFDLLQLTEFLKELPWIARFIAEESTMIDITKGDISKLRESERVPRIVSAFAGAVAFLVLQARN